MVVFADHLLLIDVGLSEGVKAAATATVTARHRRIDRTMVLLFVWLKEEEVSK